MSLESQEHEKCQLAAQRGLTVVAVHTDPAIPAHSAIVLAPRVA
jgi:hypothetical protein